MNNSGMMCHIPQNIENKILKISTQRINTKKNLKKHFCEIEVKRGNTDNANKNLPICFKCEKVGHYKNKCRRKQKINEINIDEGLRRQLLQLLVSSSESEDIRFVESHDSSSEYSSEEAKGYRKNCKCKDCTSSDIHLGIFVLTMIEKLDKIQVPEKKAFSIYRTC